MSALKLFDNKYMFTVENQATGSSFQVEKNEIILDGAMSNGIGFPYGCRNGFCGKCKATLIEGEVDYENGVPPGLSEQEVADRMILPCKCSAKSDLSIVLTELESVADIEVRTLPCKVDKIERLNHDVAKVVLKIPGNEALQYLAGQYIDLIHPDFEPRAFSIANAPHNTGLIELHVRLISGGKFTNFVFNELQEKSLLKIEGPKGSFYLRETSEKPMIMVAGGTGFGPVKAMVEHAIESNTQRKIDIYWGARTEQDLYTDLPQTWAKEYDYINFIPVLSQADEQWQGRTGYVHEAVLADFETLTNYEVYACGPPEMVRSAANTFVKKGMFENNFYNDSFDFAYQAGQS
ncbi:MAG: CDP-6-deoxy-delta-3,4-glucoseen reductase [Candidatus Thioglobus sp.]|uniref:CDP-6-deoxy-delta-3,4-glucoseen reductase n=1 Tax=Candidatus Thioglobus sp. TaxID=2026721 RepID=UPI00260CBA63|nr:CDP-6-deoxy-delta-3,4-glucoseen reductase [Candidatus Thioglobus sp.]MDC9727010.1 CDP-6-deoxy-delta-3,4-glucoseen reductase [Candidatus Thioglobus sp.]